MKRTIFTLVLAVAALMAMAQKPVVGETIGFYGKV
jgi:hypothetical protein